MIGRDGSFGTLCHMCHQFKFPGCNKKYKKELDEELKQQFAKGDRNKFGLMLQKSVYPYDCVDDWERFNEALLPEKNTLQ